MDSTAEEDICGSCQGDGTKCDIIRGFYDKQNLELGYNEVVTIPVEARNIIIEEKNITENYIAIASVSSKHFFLNGKRQVLYDEI